jgi:hypothetical protein
MSVEYIPQTLQIKDRYPSRSLEFQMVIFLKLQSVTRSVTICLEGLVDVAAFYWLTSMVEKKSITYHLYIFGAINSKFKFLRRLKNVLTTKN